MTLAVVVMVGGGSSSGGGSGSGWRLRCTGRDGVAVAVLLPLLLQVVVVVVDDTKPASWQYAICVMCLRINWAALAQAALGHRTRRRGFTRPRYSAELSSISRRLASSPACKQAFASTFCQPTLQATRPAYGPRTVNLRPESKTPRLSWLPSKAKASRPLRISRELSGWPGFRFRNLGCDQ